MKITLPDHIGFCQGVSNAVNKALAVKGGGYCLGELIHNTIVNNRLAQNNVTIVDDVEQIPDGATMIVRSHGVPPSVYERAKQKRLKIVDATCGCVKAIQKKAEKYYREGYQIVLVGNSSHPEVIGINGWCNNTAIIFDGKGKLCLDGYEKVLIMFQTTFDTRFYEKSLQNISTDGVKTLEIFNTICYTTTVRQYYAQILSQQSDLTVVIGDAKSSNTKRLFDIASANCKTILTDGVTENIDVTNCKNISIISGASTPTELIKGVLERMVENAKEAVAVETAVSATPAEDVKKVDKNEEMLANAVSSIKEGAKFKIGQKVKCKVVLVSEDGVYVSLGNWKQEGIVPNEELALDGNYQAVKASLKDGDVLECSVLSTDKGIRLSKKVIDERYKDDELVAGIKEGNEFEVTMTRVGKECLTGKLGSYTVIVHASQIKIGYVKNLEQYVGKKLRLVSNAEKVDDNKRVIFASQKTILLAEKKAKEDEFWNNIEVDEIVEGTVLRFAPFGAFINVRGFDCLAHSTDLSWDRISGPQEVLEIGKEYEFVVLALDREKNRVSLGYKQLQPQPWQIAEEKFHVGAVVTGKVARIMPFGAFIELDKHIDGLLHVSNVSWEWLDDINKALKVGDEIEVEVLEFDAERKRITLSRKSLLKKPETTPATSDEE